MMNFSCTLGFTVEKQATDILISYDFDQSQADRSAPDRDEAICTRIVSQVECRQVGVWNTN